MQRLKKFFSLGSICLTVILLCTTTTPAFVYASNPSAVQENQNIEQLIKIDLETGEETIVDLPSISTISEIERNSSASSEPSLNTVYDDDNRTVISNTTVSPYYGITYLNVTFTNNKTYRGTAFMISPNVMLTAGHNLYESGYKVSNITAYPGRNGSSKPLTATAKTFYLDTKYTGTQENLDYGIIILDKNIGNTTGWFGLHATTSSSSIGTSKITVTGYPSDLVGYKMWKDTGTVSSVTDYRFKHNADTYKGNSGSPTYAYSSSYGNQVYGIHTHGGNYSRRITMSLFDWLESEGFIQ